MMRFGEVLRLVWINLIGNKNRMLMTSLGIVVGAATIVLVIAVGQGGQADVADQFKNLNAGAIEVTATDEAPMGEMMDMMGGGMPGGGGGMSSFGGGGGAGINIVPVAFLIVKEDNVRLLPIAPPPGTAVDRVIELVPEVMDKVTGFIEKQQDRAEARDKESF